MVVKLLILVLAILFVEQLVQQILYQRTTYYKVTKNSRFKVMHDKGKHGEYLLWEKLRSVEKEGGRFLFNLYLPKERGGTTEIDVLLIAPQGIFVFESKNYSGWIFGSEKSRLWMQTLPAGRRKSHKERFLNPIMQNELHVRCLKKIIGNDMPIRSIIVFSDHCELKKLDVNMSGAIQVVKRSYVSNIVSGMNWGVPLSEGRIEELYKTLYPYSQATDDVKAAHIADIQAKMQETDADELPSNVIRIDAHQPSSVKAEPIRTQVHPIEKTSAVPAPQINDNSLVCPRCGGKLVLRTAKRGSNIGNSFYGCSNYPKCRYTRNA